MKRLIATVLVSVFLSVVPAGLARADAVIEVDGKKIVHDAVVKFLSDQEKNVPVGEVIFWPLRKVAEALDCKVVWDGEKAVLSRDQVTVAVRPHDAKVYDEKGRVIGRLEYPVEVSRDHLYAELEFFTRFLGAREVR
ncbi:MAG: stalk domain-containing protein [Desulfotomaculales bacterium]